MIFFSFSNNNRKIKEDEQRGPCGAQGIEKKWTQSFVWKFQAKIPLRRPRSRRRGYINLLATDFFF